MWVITQGSAIRIGDRDILHKLPESRALSWHGQRRHELQGTELL